MTPEPNLSTAECPDGSRSLQIHARGLAVLDDPQVNRGTAFTMAERDHLGLHGLLPSGLETIDGAGGPVLRAVPSRRDSDVAKWVFLTQLHDSNEVLFYRLVGEHVPRCCRSSTRRRWARRSRSSATCSADPGASS